MKHAPLLFALLLTPAAAGMARPASAAPPVFIVTGKGASDRADELTKRGLALGDKDNFAESERVLREAWALKHAYDIAANLALVEAELGHWRAAAEHMTFALKNFPSNGDPRHRAVGETTLTRALPHVTALTIKTNVDKADVLVDGTSAGTAPLADVVFLDPGPHTVTATLAGYQQAQARVDARAGAAPEVKLSLVKSTDATPGAEKRPIWPAILSGVIAAGGIAAGAGLTVAANSKGSSAATLRTTLGGARNGCAGATTTNCQALHDDGAAQTRLANAALGAFVAGGAIALVSAGLAVWTVTGRKDQDKRSAWTVKVAPSAGPREGGVVVVGRW